MKPARAPAVRSSSDTVVSFEPDGGQVYDMAPIPTHVTRPDYPVGAREEGVHGAVLVEFVIDSSGRVSRARVLRSVRELDSAAVACVLEWRFKPALRAGRPVEATARTSVEF